jgi:hypothetical protein
LSLAILASANTDNAVRRKRDLVSIEDIMDGVSGQRGLATEYESEETSGKGGKSAKTAKSSKSGKGDKSSKSSKSGKSSKSEKSSKTASKGYETSDEEKKTKAYGIGEAIWEDVMEGMSMSMSYPSPPTVVPVPTTPAPTEMTSFPNGTTPAPVVTPPTLSPTTSTPVDGCSNVTRAETIAAQLMDITDIGLLSDVTSPQGQAFSWLVEVDTGLADPCTYPTILDRYALATLFFATGGSSWTTSTGWLTDEYECSWSGITCDGTVTSIALCKCLKDTLV